MPLKAIKFSLQVHSANKVKLGIFSLVLFLLFFGFFLKEGVLAYTEECCSVGGCCWDQECEPPCTQIKRWDSQYGWLCCEWCTGCFEDPPGSGQYLEACMCVDCGGFGKLIWQCGAGCEAPCDSDGDCQSGLTCIGNDPGEEAPSECDGQACCWAQSICGTTPDPDKYGWVSGQVYVGSWPPTQSRVFSDNTVSCSGLKSSSIQVKKGGSNILSSWFCGGGNQAYYKTSNVNLGSDGQESVSLTLIPPSGYSCSGWSYTICLNSDCTQKEQADGLGCTTGTFNMREGDYVNHVSWSLYTANQSPVCDITGGATNVCTSKSYYYTSSSSDPDGDPLTYQWDDGACNGHFIAGMTDTSIYPDPTWTPPNVGGACTLNLQVADGKGGICTDSYPVSVNYNPSCGIIDGPATTYINEDTQFTLVAGDFDFDTLTYTWTATCGTFVGSTNSAAVTWRAPATVGASCTLTAKASDECWSCYPSPTKAVTVGQRKVQGTIWLVPDGGSCADGPSGNEITPGDVASVTISSEGIAGTWGSPGDPDGFYEVVGVPASTAEDPGTINVNITPNAGDNFTYVLGDPECVSSSTGAGPVRISGSTASFVVDGETEVVDLGFVKKRQGWVQSSAGDIFGAGIRSIIPKLPLGGFLPFMISGEGTAIARGDIDVKNTEGQDALTEDGYYVKEYSSTSFWPLSLSEFKIPTDAVEISGSSTCKGLFSDLSFKLDIDKVYQAKASCINDAINGAQGTPKEYKINTSNDPQVTVIYVEDDVDLKFLDTFVSQKTQRRLIFVVEGDVLFDKAVGSLNPASSQPPHIEVGLIVYGQITFESKGDLDSDGYFDDTTIIIEGPITAKNGVGFFRDRGKSNDYPSIVVRYNPFYMSQLFRQEKDYGYTNYTGILTSESSIVEWVYID